MRIDIFLATAFTFATLAASCVKEPQQVDNPTTSTTPVTSDKTWSVDGSVQKGPFTQGTSITIQALDEQLNPTGKNYSTKTTDDAGSFAIDNKIESRYVEIIAQGYYFNEIEGKVSSSTLTLRSLSDLSEEGKTNVNLLTTLESDRIRALVKGGKSIAQAREQAEQEIFGVFNIPNTVSADAGFDKMDITKGTDADGILLAISSSLQAGRTVGELSELVSKIAGDVASTGKVESDLIRSKISEGCTLVDADAVRSHLTRRYADLGLEGFAIPPFEDYLDVNGDGVIDKKNSWIILGQKEFIISDKGGDFELALQHNVDYEVIIEGTDWLSRNDVPGTKAYLQDTRLSFNAQPNPDPEERYAVIKIKDKASSHVEQATVTQKHKDAVTVSASSIELEKDGGSFEITVSFNYPQATYSIDVPWLSAVQTKSMQSLTMTFKAAPNPEVETRIGHIKFEGEEVSETVTVYQKGGRSIILSDKQITVGPEGGTQIYIQATANVDFEVFGPGVPWLTLTQDAVTRASVTHNYTYLIEENNTGEERRAVILFKDKESDLSESVKIIQRQNDVMNGNGEYKISYEGGIFDVPVETNVDFTPSIEQEGNWLSVVSTKALFSRIITLKAEKNEDASPRTAHLVLTAGDSQWRITIIQRGNAQQVTVNVPTPGTLSQLISEEELHKIINLKITGTLNKEDLKLLTGGHWEPGSPYAGQQGPHIECDWCVEDLDLSEMTTESGEIGTNEQFFGYIPSLVKVIMPLHVETVGEQVFRRCESLETVDFGSNSDILTICGSVHSQAGIGIGQTTYHGAFEQCRSLKEVTLPDNLEELQAGAFLNCSGLQKVIFPSTCNVRALKCSSSGFSTGISYIKTSMGHFWGCTSLETVELPASLRRIEAGALTGGQFRRLVIPETVTEIYTENMFDGCTRLEEVSLPSCVKQYDKYMFADCINLTKINIAANITKYGDHCFDGANSALFKLDPSIEYGEGVFANMDMESVSIPSGMTAIPNSMFAGCKNIKNLQLGEVETIGESAFARSGLERLVLPASVKFVGSYAFGSCESLSDLVIKSEHIVFDGPFASCEKLTSLRIPNTVISITGDLGAHIYYNGDYSSNMFTEIIFEPGSRCEEFGIAGHTGITSITLPPSIRRLTKSAFAGTALKIIDLPEGLEHIGEEAFAYSALRNMTLPSSVDSIEARAFSNCKKLYTFEVPAASCLRFVGEEAFGYCENLESFTMNGAESLDVYASCFCKTSIREFVLGKNVRNLAFFGTNQQWQRNISTFNVEEGSVLEKIEIKGRYDWEVFASSAVINLPPTIKVIGDSAFENFGGTIASSDFSNVVSIGKRAFKGFKGELNANFAKLNSIPDFAFERFAGVMKNTDFSNVVSIGEGAFEEFTGSIDLDWNNALFNTVESIGRYAFAKIALLSGTINLPKIKTIGEWAFMDNKIKKITFGADLFEVQDNIFANFPEPLEEIHFTGPYPPGYDGYTPIEIDSYLLGYANLSSSFKIYVPSAYYQDYLDHAPEQWRGYLTAE